MRAGELNRRITIQQPTVAKDQYKRVTTGWVDFKTVWAAVEPLNGREYIQAQNTNAEITVRFRIRYLPDVTNAMRVLYDGRVFNLNSPPIDLRGAHEEMHLMCVEENS